MSQIESVINTAFFENPELHSHYGVIDHAITPDGKQALLKKYGFQNDSRGIDMSMSAATATGFAQLVFAFNEQSNAMGIKTPRLYDCKAVPREDNSGRYIIHTLQEYLPGVTLDKLWLYSLENNDTVLQHEILEKLLGVINTNFHFDPPTEKRHLFPYRPREKKYYHPILNPYEVDNKEMDEVLRSTQLPLTFDMKLNNFLFHQGEMYYTDLTPPCSLTPHGNSALMNLNPNALKEDPGRKKGMLLGTSAQYVNIKVCAELAGTAHHLYPDCGISLFEKLIADMQLYCEENYKDSPGMINALSYEIQNGFPFYTDAIRRNERVRFGPLLGIELTDKEKELGGWK